MEGPEPLLKGWVSCPEEHHLQIQRHQFGQDLTQQVQPLLPREARHGDQERNISNRQVHLALQGRLAAPFARKVGRRIPAGQVPISGRVPSLDVHPVGDPHQLALSFS